MRRFILGAVLSFSFASLAAAQSNISADIYYDKNVKPHLTSYVACSLTHLEKRAKSTPDRTFKNVEASLKPACGANIDRAKEAMMKIGLPISEVNGLIRKWYIGIEGDMRSFHERSVAEAVRQRDIARLEAEKERQSRETDAERSKLLKEAAADHHSCLRKEMINIVPFSNEGAETLGTVIMTKCAEHEKKRVSLAIALFGVGRMSAERALKEISDETRKIIIAEIVTFRADLAKGQTQGQPTSRTLVPAKQGIGI